MFVKYLQRLVHDNCCPSTIQQLLFSPIMRLALLTQELAHKGEQGRHGPCPPKAYILNIYIQRG